MNSPSRYVAAAAILLSAITLGISYALPTVTFEVFRKVPEIYSIWGGIEILWEDGNTILAPTVFLFSMIFPVGKLLCLALVLSPWTDRFDRRRMLAWLHLLGKWSMLDVFIVGVFVAAVQLGVAHADSRWGIHVFALAIVMSMGCTWLVTRLEEPVPEPASAPSAGLRSPLGRFLALARSLAIVGMLALPLLKVSKELAFGIGPSNEVHLGHTTLRLAREGEFLLAVALGLFVIAIPILRAAFALRLRWLGGEGRRALRMARALDAWAMVDVMGLGLLIVQVKLAELTKCELLWGFWLTLAAAVLALAESWHLRRVTR